MEHGNPSFRRSKYQSQKFNEEIQKYQKELEKLREENYNNFLIDNKNEIDKKYQEAVKLEESAWSSKQKFRDSK